MVNREDMPRLCPYAAEDPREPDVMMYCSTKKIPITVYVSRRDRFGGKNMDCVPCTVKEEIITETKQEILATAGGGSGSSSPKVLVKCDKLHGWVLAGEKCIGCERAMDCRGYEDAMKKFSSRYV